MAIGPAYPEPFKKIMQDAPSLRQQLEDAIRASQSSSVSTSSIPAASGVQQAAKIGVQAPSIKLKMDFSNFK